MMNYVCDDLRSEHEGILFGISILEKMTALIEGNQSIPLEDLYEMIGFFKLFADKCHHGKEENLLFPVMIEFDLTLDGVLIKVLLTEHSEGRIYLSLMTDSLTDQYHRDDFIASSKNYCELLRKHIQKENTSLFPLADNNIPANRQEALSTAFEKFEEEVMGKGTHEKLHETLHKFEKKYLEQV
ncbi:MAG: hemerythrin [Eubacteriaceae bacterium]|nr:hemerythrin [Eubacteriaceae bacterium]